LGFAVRPPAQRRASPRSHRMPCGDVSSRVHVRVADISAGHAAEEGLALAALRCDVPAHRATLAGVRGMNLLHPVGGLILQAARQQAPAGTQDAPVQRGLLPDIPARAFDGAPGRTGHVGDAQVLDPDQVEPAGQICRGLLSPVLAPITFPGAQPRDLGLDPGTPGGAPRGAGELVLQPSQPDLLGREQARTAQQLASGQGSRHRHPAVHAHHLAGTRTGDGQRDGSERDMPSPGPVTGDPVGLGRWDGARPSEPHPPGLRHPDLTDVPGQPTYVTGLDRDDPEAFVPSGLAPGGFVVSADKVVGHGLGEVPQRLLLHHLAAFPQPCVFGPGLSQLSVLCAIPWCTAAAGAPPGLLLGGEVPDVPGVRAVPGQDGQLRWRRCQPVAGHESNLITTTDSLERGERRSLSGLEAKVFTPRTR
jgi:hypothetical protein